MTLAAFHGKLSVVVPTYNSARYLRETLVSAASHAPSVGEIIVVDDGSVDDSADIAAAFGAPVRVVRAPHGGIGAARNRGIAQAKGEFVAVLDADDLWPAGSVAARFAAFLADPGLDVVSGHMVEFLSPDVAPELGARFSVHTQARSGYSAGTVVLRRNLFERVGMFREDLLLGELIEWMGRAHDCGAHTTILPDVVLLRRIHAGNTSHLNPIKAKDYVRVLRDALERRRKAAEGKAPQ